VETLLIHCGVSRVVFVAKHLCGVGADLALEFISRWSARTRSQVSGHNACTEFGGVERGGNDGTDEGSPTGVTLLGAVIATCCAGKMSEGDYGKFAEVHAGDVYLSSFTGQDHSSLPCLLKLCTRYSAWRTATRKVIGLQVRAAEVLEDVLQQPRLNLLRRIFPEATEVAYAPPIHPAEPMPPCWQCRGVTVGARGSWRWSLPEGAAGCARKGACSHWWPASPLADRILRATALVR